MASVVIAGDVSGTCTLQAANAAGTTTLTLPTTSGTLVSTGGVSSLAFGLGNASAPSITFTGDTNTGIFSPAADTIAFAEGGVESMRIDSSGNVGIGTSSPSSFGNLAVVSPSGATTLAIRNFGGSAQTASIKFSQTGSGGDVRVQSNVSNDDLQFWTAATERMRIDSSGNVGIGTSSPGTRLDVVGGTIRSTVSGGTPILFLNNGSSQHSIQNNSGVLGLFNDGTNVANLTNAGLFQFNSGYGSVATAYGCRAWVNFVGSSGSIRASGGVSSITRNGTGDYTVNFSITFPDINYCTQLTGMRDSDNNGSLNTTVRGNPTYSSSVTTTTIRILAENDSGTRVDPTYYGVAVFR